ncbi:15706_t:CDS:1, partial [Dentiscutata heterogama]
KSLTLSIPNISSNIELTVSAISSAITNAANTATNTARDIATIAPGLLSQLLSAFDKLAKHNFGIIKCTHG